MTNGGEKKMNDEPREPGKGPEKKLPVAPRRRGPFNLLILAIVLFSIMIVVQQWQRAG